MAGRDKPRMRLAVTGLLLSGGLLPVWAQEKPLNLNGEIVTGFYTAENRNAGQLEVSTLPFSFKLNLDGYLGHPDFLNFQVRPHLGFGAQAAEAGFADGNGFSLLATFLRRRAVPVTITYSDTEREQVSFGRLSRTSGLRSVSRQRNLGVNSGLYLKGLPRISFDFGQSSSKVDPDLPLIPVAESDSTNYGAYIDDTRWGWKLDGKLRWTRHASEFANTLEPEFTTVSTRRRSAAYELSAQHQFWGEDQVVLQVGRRKHENLLNARRFDQDIDFANAALRFRWAERWEATLRSGYSSNLLGTEIQQLLGSLGGAGNVQVPNLNPLLFLPVQSRISTFNLATGLRYELKRHWNLFGILSRDRVTAPEAVSTSSRGTYISGRGGGNYNRNFSWGVLSGQYSLEAGRSNFPGLGLSRTLGHQFSAMVQRGNPERLELMVSVNSAFRTLKDGFPLRSDNHSADFGLARRVLGVVVRGAAGIQRGDSKQNGTEFDSDGLLFRLGVEHPRFRLQYSQSAIDGLSLTHDPANNGLLGIPLGTIRTGSRARMLTAQANPWRNFQLSARWIRSRLSLRDRLQNRHNNLEFTARYKFRLIAVEAGYVRFDQSFFLLPEVGRTRFFVRITRPFRIL